MKWQILLLIMFCANYILVGQSCDSIQTIEDAIKCELLELIRTDGKTVMPTSAEILDYKKDTVEYNSSIKVLTNELEDVKGNGKLSKEIRKSLKKDILENNKKLRITENKLKQAINFQNRVLESYTYPGDRIKLALVDTSYINHRINLSKVGSYIFKNVDSFDVEGEPLLPVLDNERQVYIDKQGSYYQLYTNMSYLIGVTAKANLDAGFQDYIKTKTKAFLDQSLSSQQTISIAYGRFHNEMHNLFEQVRRETIHERDFAPLIRLWHLYSRNKIAKTDQILEYCDGLVIYSHTKLKSVLGQQADISINSKFKVPYISMQAESGSRWETQQTRNIGSANYSWYLTKKPKLSAIISSDLIKKRWDAFENSIPAPSYKESNNEVILVQNDEHSYVDVVFGPIPGYENVSNYVKVKKANYTGSIISRIRISKNPIKVGLDGMHTYRLYFSRNNQFFEQFSGSDRKQAELINVTLHLPDSVNGEYLGRKYSVKVVGSTLPIPILSNKEILMPTVDGSEYKWNVPVTIISSETARERAIVTSAKILTFKDTTFNYLLEEMNSTIDYGDKSSVNTFIKFKATPRINSLKKDFRIPVDISLKINNTFTRVISVNLVLRSNYKLPEEIFYEKFNLLLNGLEKNSILIGYGGLTFEMYEDSLKNKQNFDKLIPENFSTEINGINVCLCDYLSLVDGKKIMDIDEELIVDGVPFKAFKKEIKAQRIMIINQLLHKKLIEDLRIVKQNGGGYYISPKWLTSTEIKNKLK